MKKLKLFAVMENTDSTEGRGHEIPVLHTESRELATRIAKSPKFYKNHGVMGCENCGVKEIEIEIYSEADAKEKYLEQPEEREKRLNAEIRRKALSKLSYEERMVLGIKDN